MDEQKLSNKGYLFPNKRKNKSTQPDLTGKINWKGEEIQISAWEKTSPTGEKFLSISLSEKFNRPEDGNNNANGNTNSNTNISAGDNRGYDNRNSDTRSQKPRSTADLPDNTLDDLDKLFD